MRASRLFVSAAAIALVAGPGLAMAQGGPPTETPPAQTPPVEAPPETTPPVAVPDTEDADAQDLTAKDEDDAEERDDDEVAATDEGDDEGHGEIISALAECLPSGAELHGTGFTKGFVMSQAASTGEVELPDLEAAPVTTLEEATALCEAVVAMAETADAAETARGRPDGAGPEAGDQVATSSGDRRGPPAHANKGGKGHKRNGS